MRILINVLWSSILGVSCCTNNGISQNANTTTTKTEIMENNSSQPSQGRRGAIRTVEGNKIIRTVDASQLPFTIGEEFTDENQQFILVIKNFNKPTLSAKINTVEKGRNLRINQIILPDGSADGPFSREMKYAKKQSGTYKIVFGKNLMVEGKLKGNISVTVE